jgi:hypothetical protein
VLSKSELFQNLFKGVTKRPMAKIMYQSGGHSRLGANAAITFDFLYGSRKFSCCMNTPMLCAKRECVAPGYTKSEKPNCLTRRNR